MRKLYSERTVHVLKDLNEQPEGKYLVFVKDVFGSDAFGSKMVFSCDHVDITPAAIVCKRELLLEKLGEKTQFEVIAILPVRDVVWGIIEKDRVHGLTGKEFEQYKVDEGKDALKLFEEHYGSEEVVTVAILPDGRQIRVPVTKEAKAAYSELTEEEKDAILIKEHGILSKVVPETKEPDNKYGTLRNYL